MTTRGYWVIRFTGFALVGIVALVNPPHRAHQPNQPLDGAIQIACFAVVGLALVAWLLADEFPRYRTRGVPVALAVMAAASGVAGVTAGGGQSLIAFAAVATVAAGADTELPTAVVVAAAGVLPIWIAGLVTGASIGTLLGYPLLIGACLSLGRNRRSYRVQAEQAAALLQQYERMCSRIPWARSASRSRRPRRC
jgi:hypothetical protein